MPTSPGKSTFLTTYQGSLERRSVRGTGKHVAGLQNKIDDPPRLNAVATRCNCRWRRASQPGSFSIWPHLFHIIYAVDEL